MTRSTVIPTSEGVKAWRVWVDRGALSHVVHGNWFQAREAACVLLGCDIGQVRIRPYSPVIFPAITTSTRAALKGVTGYMSTDGK